MRAGLLATALLLFTGAGWAQNTNELETTRTRATQGDLEAQNALGNAYTNGLFGLKIDLPEALKWYQRAADKGYAPALFNLGLVYELGRGVGVNEAQAFKNYLAAAEQGFAPAQFNVGNMYTSGRGVGQDFFEANLWFKQAADKGLPEAQFNLGFSYESGRGVRKDEAQASRWYKLAADRGYARAQYNLGILLEDGRGVTKDSSAAAAFYKAAAEQGFAQAQVNYALMLSEGRPGVARDPVQAYVWLSRAVQSGVGSEDRDTLAKSLSPDQLSAANRLLAGRPAAAPAGEVVPGGDSSKLLEQLRDQSRRLAGQVESLNAKKVAAERQSQLLLVQVKDLQQELQQAKLAPKSGSPVDVSGYRNEITALTTKLEQANNQNAELNQRLTQAQSGTSKGRGADAAKQASMVANLQRDNTRLNDEVKRSTVELLSLNSQLRDLQRQSVAKPRASTGGVVPAALTAQVESLTADNRRLVERITELEQAAKYPVAEMDQSLADTITVHTRGGDGNQQLQADLKDALQSIDKLSATVAELTAANDKLEMDLDNAQKSTAAALAAQSQAVSAASPDAFQMEISTLNARIKQLEARMEEERSSAAREVTTLAAQLQRTSETNKSLTEANRALVAGKDSDSSANQEELDRLQGRIRELTGAAEEQRKAGGKLATDLRNLTEERDALKSQLVDARQVATTLPGLADEKAALDDQLGVISGQLAQLQHEYDELQKSSTDLAQQLTQSQQTAEQAQQELAAWQGKAAEAEKAATARTASVAELTQANAKFELESKDMQRLIESYRGDIALLTQRVSSAEQLRAEGERSGQQNIDALTAQLGQLRRELDAARLAQNRMTENFAAQDRDRVTVIAKLQADNGALNARLGQAQSTLDQIASAARLGTPAAAIASGGSVPLRPAAQSATTSDARIHSVTEGDSLSRISMRYYGTANRWQEIYQANLDVLQGSNTLRVGMQLRIP